MPRMLFRRAERMSMNSTVLVQLAISDLRPALDLEVQYGLPLSVLSDHLHLVSSPEITRLHERVRYPQAKRVEGRVHYQLFQTNGPQTLGQVLEEFDRLFWCPVGTRPLMHFAAMFEPQDMPYEILGLGSHHQLYNGVEAAQYFPCLTHEREKWHVRGVSIEPDHDVSQYTFLAWR